MHAIEIGSKDALEVLLAAGIDVNQTDEVPNV